MIRPLRIHPDPNVKYFDPFANDKIGPDPEDFYEFYKNAILKTEMVYKARDIIPILTFEPIANNPALTKDFK